MLQLAIMLWMLVELSAPTWCFCCWGVLAGSMVFKILWQFVKFCKEVGESL